MLKSLPFIVAFLIFLQASQPVPRETSGSRSQAGSEMPVATPNPPNPPTTMQHSVALTSLPPVTIAEGRKTFLDYVFAWGPWVFNLFLVIAGLGQVYLLYVTLNKIKRQADLMNRQTVVALASVNTASRQVEHMVASERAWVQVSIPNPPQIDQKSSKEVLFRIWPQVQNYGKTPAHVDIITIRPHQIARGNEFPEPPALPPEPEYIAQETVAMMRRGFLPPTMAIQPLAISISEADFNAIRDRRTFLYVYGQIFYHDSMGVGRETRFCYLYYIPPGSGMDHPESFITYTKVPDTYMEYT